MTKNRYIFGRYVILSKEGVSCLTHTGAFEEDMLILGEKDLKQFKKKYGITGEIKKIY